MEKVGLRLERINWKIPKALLLTKRGWWLIVCIPRASAKH